jgi:hypothetical protein
MPKKRVKKKEEMENFEYVKSNTSSAHDVKKITERVQKEITTAHKIHVEEQNLLTHEHELLLNKYTNRKSSEVLACVQLNAKQSDVLV